MNDSTSGFAGGTVTVTMPSGETSNRAVVMYWANEGGKLDGYTPLARFKVTGEVTEFTFTESMVVPKGATRLLVYSQNTSTGALSEEFASVELPSGSDMKDGGEIITSFFIISDIHIGRGDGTVSATNFKKMLEEAIALNPNGTAIFIVGDMADGGTEAQFAEMMSLHAEVMAANFKDAESYPLFLTLGNHDYPAMSNVFLQYATLPDGTHPEDTSYDFWLNGYHYIFLGSDTSSGLYANLSDETLEWLDQKLGECRDSSRPTFVFLHQPMYNTVSGSLPGEGWHGVSNEDALRAVLSKYPEVMFFNGHTHWTMDSVGNIFEGTEELPIHIFNCASVSYLWSGFNKTGGENLDGSQGYYIEMYDGGVFVRGRDFMSGEWISSAQYLIEFTESEGDGHTYEQEIRYENGYAKEGVITYVCSACGEGKEETAPALFTVVGYSLCEDGQNGIALGYKVNNEAIEAYERITGKTLSYGVFAVQKEKLSERDLFDENGNAASGAITADITSYTFVSFQLKILGFEDAYKDELLAMGAYVKVTDGESISYSYLQAEAPSVGEKYSYTSYNKVSSKEDTE
ncbi:MAG: metallophosphoesterase [Clostridia bacterium]|nr:metallophosphoesterase [Clostridia bacterium]